MDSFPVEIDTPPSPKITHIDSPSTLSSNSTPNQRLSKDGIRTSLKSFTVDGIFAAVFSYRRTGVILA